MAESRAFTSAAGEERLDRFLSAQLPELSRTRVQALIRAGAVTVDGAAITRTSEAVRPGALIEVAAAAPPPAAAAPEPEAIPLEVLYEDDDLAVINKQAGLVVHAGAGHRTGTLVNALLHRYGALSGGDQQRPGIVHRLDKETSGVMIVARTDAAHLRLAEQFQRRSLSKTYLALVHGVFTGTARGEIDLPIHRDLRNRLRMTTRRRDGREARTSYRVLETLPGRLSWLEVDLHTGRTHQIRVHLSAIAHPIVGDRLYGAPALLTAPAPLAGFRPPRPMLHAVRIAFTHPRTGAALDFTAPLPDDIAALLQSLRAHRDANPTFGRIERGGGPAYDLN